LPPPEAVALNRYFGFHHQLFSSRMKGQQDIAKVALFLASPYADYISGAALVVDGGLLSKLPLPEYW